VLLERAEFLCSVSDLAAAHARQKMAGKVDGEKKSLGGIKPQPEQAPGLGDQLALLPAPGQSSKKGKNGNKSPTKKENHESPAQKRARELVEGNLSGDIF